jgi:rfaE bifunctional protein nucleotidyltransferase chain/domain
VPGATLATPNAGEAAAFAPDAAEGDDVAAVAARARALVSRWEAGAVAVTMGRRGALLSGAAGAPLLVPAPPAALADPCGAGDRFAAAAAGALADGAVPSEAVEVAVAAASAFVAAGGAAAVGTDAPPADVPARGAGDVVDTVRAEGGTVVATGGCFDLLHAGHVAMLQAARALGDCLVVCLNGDESVRRLKGPDRPLQPASDRAAVLLALDCVDAVVVFDEDTPVRALEELRPSIFAKGADYAGADLPEARALAGWGGQVVAVPYLQGRSTTRLLQEAVRRAR